MFVTMQGTWPVNDNTVSNKRRKTCSVQVPAGAFDFIKTENGLLRDPTCCRQPIKLH
jgi:hypothetical protein